MITVTPYQEIWPKRFQEEKQILNVLFQKIPVDLHHIGSTAVIGLSAKPIIDILGVTPDITLIDALNVDLEELGYEPLGEFGMKQRRFFRKKDTFHLHIFEDSDPDVCRHLRFVAYVSAHPEAVANYSTLKQKLAVENSDDMTGYLLGKVGWI